MAASQHTPAARSGSPRSREPGGDTRAIEQVLEAERAAERSVLEASEEAERRLANARDRARAVAVRADQRIQNLHARSAARADRAVEDLFREHEARMDSERVLGDEARLDAASERVADWLLAPKEPTA